jgi:hypothetical protein
MLKERLIELLRAQPKILDMTCFMTNVSWNDIRYDIVGLILKVAGYSLQSDSAGLPKLPFNAPLLDKKWVEFEAQHSGALKEIPALARQIWAEEYGEKEAKELPIYDKAHVHGDWWWDDLEQLNHNHLIAFLNGQRSDIYALNGPAEIGR